MTLSTHLSAHSGFGRGNLFLVIGTLQLLPQKCVYAAYLIDLYFKSCSLYFVNGFLREVKLPKVVVIGFSAVLNNHKHDRFNWDLANCYCLFSCQRVLHARDGQWTDGLWFYYLGGVCGLTKIQRNISELARAMRCQNVTCLCSKPLINIFNRVNYLFYDRENSQDTKNHELYSRWVEAYYCHKPFLWRVLFELPVSMPSAKQWGPKHCLNWG